MSKKKVTIEFEVFENELTDEEIEASFNIPKEEIHNLKITVETLTIPIPNNV